MMTVHEVSRLTGVSIRALHYYDEIGLLHPAVTTDAGYRLYDGGSLQRLQQIMLFRELEFPLREIKAIIDSPDFDRAEALEQQIALLTLKKEHIEGLIEFARKIRSKGDADMDYSAFDKRKMDAYAAEAKQKWGHTEAYREFEQKAGGRSDDEQAALQAEMMGIFASLGGMKELRPDAPEVQAEVRRLQDFITAHYYTCTNEILAGLGQMYVSGGEMTDNIDAAGGKGTAEFASRAIAAYCG